MVAIAIPILTGKDSATSKDSGVSERTQYYAIAKSLMISGSDAVERLFTSYKELLELAGYTARVATMCEVFEDCSVGKYKRPTMLNEAAAAATTPGRKRNKSLQVSGDDLGLKVKDGTPVIEGKVMETGDGTLILDRVPIVTPNCDVVVPNLSLTVRPGMHLLISGPNGCGKSSLFRIISGLWPVYKGVLRKPSTGSMFYIPQRPYMSVGSLRDQVIYPDTMGDMKEKGVTDADLEAILQIVHLKHIVRREGGWGIVGDWKDILSGRLNCSSGHWIS